MLRRALEHEALYNAVKHPENGKMNFVGSLTQSGACVTHGPCPGSDNSPGVGWSQLYDQPNSDSRSADTTLYSTDISYQ